MFAGAAQGITSSYVQRRRLDFTQLISLLAFGYDLQNPQIELQNLLTAWIQFWQPTWR